MNQWKLSSLSDTVKVARNCAKFNARIDSCPPCKVTLIDSFSYLEVHVELDPRKEHGNLFPSIKNTILNGIEKACEALHYTSTPKPMLCFFCPKFAMPFHEQCCADATEWCRHIAIPVGDSLSCEMDGCPGYYGDLTNKHLVWFQGQIKENAEPAASASVGIERRGTSTKEYKVFRTKFDLLATAISSCVEEVARKVFAKDFITLRNLEKAENQLFPKVDRASEMLGIVLNKINEKARHFETFVSILREFASLKDIADELDTCSVCSS